MRVRNLDTKGNTLAAAFTFSHGTCTSCSEVRNQNNQLDYCSRLPGKMQAFFQKILRFFGKPNSFSHRCAMPAVPLLALCATSPGRGSLSQRRSLWRKGQAFSFAKGPISEGAVCEADWGSSPEENAAMRASSCSKATNALYYKHNNCTGFPVRSEG